MQFFVRTLLKSNFHNIFVSYSNVGREIAPLPIVHNASRGVYPNNDVTHRAQFPSVNPVQNGTVTVNVRPLSSYTSLPGFQPTVAITTAQELPRMTSNPAPLVPVALSRAPRMLETKKTLG